MALSLLENLWVLQSYRTGDRLELKSIDSTEIENVYEDVVFKEIISDRLFIPEEN